jgi:hypothetical protein
VKQLVNAITVTHKKRDLNTGLSSFCIFAYRVNLDINYSIESIMITCR